MKCIIFKKYRDIFLKTIFSQKLMCTKNLLLIVFFSCFMLPRDFISIPDVITTLDKLIPTASVNLSKYFMEIFMHSLT